MQEQIRFKKMRLRPKASMSAPEFGVPPVLSGDPWDYVALSLRRHQSSDASFYWAQARSFFDATAGLPNVASPLTSYYSMLNAAKALLLAKRRVFSDQHGVSGYHAAGHVALKNEHVFLQPGGVLAALALFLGEPVPKKEGYTLEALLYNIPFVHRSFSLTFKAPVECFLPLMNPFFVRDTKSKYAWFSAEVPKRYMSMHFDRVLPSGWERETHRADPLFVRRKKRFIWNGRDQKASLERLTRYHRSLRRVVQPIFASPNRWYLRRSVADEKRIDRSWMVLAFAAMHRLSELSRYTPDRLGSHFDKKQNWLLAEFLRSAMSQFVYGIACEMTGREFLRPDSY